MILLRTSIFLVLALFGFINSGCTKEKDLFAEIRSQIQGRWKLEYYKGGIANITQYPSNSYYSFISNRILIESNNRVHADTEIKWTKQLAVFSGGIQVFVMNIYDTAGLPWNYVVDRITNDSLVLHDNASDPFHYHFSKQ